MSAPLPWYAVPNAISSHTTEEDLIAKNLGLEQLGTRGEPARDRSTGSGFVAKRDGAYADALTKGSDVHLCVTENSGAINGVLSSILRGLSAAARVPGAVDSNQPRTARGASRPPRTTPTTSPRYRRQCKRRTRPRSSTPPRT